MTPTVAPALSGMLAPDLMKKERDRFVAFAFAAADILIELDTDGIIHFADGAVSGLLGVSIESLQGRKFEELLIAEDKGILANLLAGIETVKRMDNISLTLQRQSDDLPLPVSVSAFHFSALDGHLFLSISASRGASMESEIRRRDLRTGFLNKEAFVDQANERIREAEASGEALEITLLDLPQLKALLDELNPSQASRLMQEVGEYLRSKSIDGDLAATITEGSAYSLLHDAKVNAQEIVSSIRNIIKSIDPHAEVEAHSHTVKADLEGLTKQDSANALLYTLNRFAEEKGENFTIEALSDSYQEMLHDTVSKIANFKDILSDSQFDVAFQPILDIKTGIVHHFECLVRLKDDCKDSFASPFHFISFGEAAGLINEFDLLMTQKALDVLSEAKERNERPFVAVNVSGKSLSSSLFMDSFHQLLNQQPRVRKQVIIEITESSKISDMRMANAFIQKLRSEGNQVCLDDFGTGESSFDYLRNLQVDFIKIDGSYVKESMQTQHGRDMLRAMAGLCRTLNMVTIGEMVEDEKCAALLWECGVKFGQGYFFGKPDANVAQLAGCGKVSPNYPGIMRAKRISHDPNRARWRNKKN